MAASGAPTTPQLFDMTGKVAVVTGGGRGIGEGIAHSLAEAGAAVVVAARRVEEIEQVAADIVAAGGQATAVATDVTDEDALEALAQAAVDTYGRLDTWVNNAGGSPARMKLDKLPREEWDNTISLNLTAVYVASVKAARKMETGSIINISSGAGFGAIPKSAHYGAAKAGVHSLTYSLAAELAPRVRVNCVAPGASPTEIMMQALDLDEESVEGLVDAWQIPMGRLGTPQDIGAACLYFASDASSWVTGQVIQVSGAPSRR